MKDRVKVKQLLVPETAKKMAEIGYKQFKKHPIFYSTDAVYGYRITYPHADIMPQSGTLYCEWITLAYKEANKEFDIRNIMGSWDYGYVKPKENTTLEQYLIGCLVEFYKQAGYFSGVTKILKKAGITI